MKQRVSDYDWPVNRCIRFQCLSTPATVIEIGWYCGTWDCDLSSNELLLIYTSKHFFSNNSLFSLVKKDQHLQNTCDFDWSSSDCSFSVSSSAASISALCACVSCSLILATPSFWFSSSSSKSCRSCSRISYKMVEIETISLDYFCVFCSSSLFWIYYGFQMN